ncbi:MAG: PorP/SprF family type IX secretion system membrane protein [Bacteroidia bacterium]
MKRVIQYIVLTVTAFVYAEAGAQQVALTSQYDLVSSLQNPAYNGINNTIRVDGISRVQWMNFPGSPKYTGLAVQTPVSQSFALGGSFQSLGVGDFEFAPPLSMSSYCIDLAYHKKILKNLNIATGIRTGLFSFGMNLGQLKSEVPNDIAVAGNNYSFNSPLIGGGVLAYGKNYYAGISIPQFAVISDRIIENVNLNYNARSYYLFTAGYVQHLLRNKFALKPTVQIRKYEGLKEQIDANIYLYYRSDFMLGYGYRSSGSHQINGMLKVNSYFNIYYLYEFGRFVNEGISFNSQEFGLRYELNYREQKVKTPPRYY